MDLTHPKPVDPITRRYAIIAISLSGLALILAIVSLFFPRPGPGGTTSAARVSSLDKIKKAHVIRAGYSGFRPYTIVDPGAKNPTERVKGYCVDMLEEIAARQNPPWKIEWYKVTFETLRADMESGRFDVFADAVYEESPRAADFGFTIPYSYFGVAVALVRRDESRFRTFEDLDRSDITIALAEGWTSTQYARKYLSKPKFKLVTVGDDPFVQLQEVLARRADVALQDIPTVLQFARAHPEESKALWIENPPTRVPAGFMTRQGEWELIHFLNVGILALQADDTLRRLDKKWQALSDFPELQLRPGTGLKEK